MNVKIYNAGENPLPEYKSIAAAGMDLRANLPDGDIILHPGDRTLVGTGLYMEIEAGYEGQIRPRSGLAAKNGVTVLNSPGTIDADYRGEVKVLLYNASKVEQQIKHGDRIAQMVFAKCERPSIFACNDIAQLSSTERGEGGFGHTGVK